MKCTNNQCRKDLKKTAQYVRKQMCSHCNFSSCKWCEKPYHVGLCLSAKERVKIIKDLGGNCTVCPTCGLIAGKDNMQACDRVQCITCSAFFNFCCSTLRTVQEPHGNHYHRPKCSNYAAFDDSQEPAHPKCPEC